jgi:hypothetical protein
MIRAFLLLFGIIFLQACKKDPSVTELLTTDDWKLESLTIDPAIIVNNVAITNYYSQLYDYDKDNTLRFKTDGTYVSDEGVLKENPNDPQTTQANWLLATSENRMTVWNETDTIEYGIPALSESHLTLTYTERDTATQVNYTFTAGFKH